MKQTHHSSYKQKEEVDKLIELLSSKKLLEEKVRINIYLPKAAVKLLDSLNKNGSRGKLVSSLILKEAAKKKKLPYGMFSGVEFSEKEIDKITYSWNKAVNELV